ncbi:hypothetical protein AAG906_031234 [Vitis piasezkii]
MGSQGGGGGGGGSGNGKQSQFQPLAWQNAMYSLTLDEVQNYFSRMWTVEANNSVGMDAEVRQLMRSGEIYKGMARTVKRRNLREAAYFGEMTLEDFLNMIGVYMPGQPMPQPLPMEPSSVMDVTYPDNQVALSSPLMGALSDTQAPGRKRKTIERRQKRMIKNWESATRSRARKQAYTNELENKVSRLEEENERLRKRKLRKILMARFLNTMPILWPKAFTNDLALTTLTLLVQLSSLPLFALFALFFALHFHKIGLFGNLM